MFEIPKTFSADTPLPDEVSPEMSKLASESFIVRPLGDRVIVRRLQEETKTKGGIYIPEQAKEKPLEGIVLAIGEGRWLEGGHHVPITLKVGDRIMFSRYSGSEIKIGEEQLLILNVSDIQAAYNWDPAEASAYGERFAEPNENAIEEEVGGPALAPVDPIVLPNGIGMSGTKPLTPSE